MRITIDVDDFQLAEIQRATGEQKKSPAIHKALEFYLHEIKKEAFLNRVLAGETDYSMTNDELEAMGEYDDID